MKRGRISLVKFLAARISWGKFRNLLTAACRMIPSWRPDQQNGGGALANGEYVLDPNQAERLPSIDARNKNAVICLANMWGLATT
jgi:hypothetical protein